MSRLAATIRFDAKLQLRYGFYYAGAFVAIVWLLVLGQLSSTAVAFILPPLLLENLLITTFYFIAGLVLLEKGEGTLEGLVVTPLRTGEYLTSKMVTLTFLATAENLIIVVAAHGLDFDPFLLTGGMVVLSLFYTLFGFVVIARYDSVTEYLLPSGLYTLVLTLPLIDYFGLWTHWIWYLLPTQAPLLLMKGAFEPVPTWQIIYGLGYSLVAVAITYWWAEKTFHRFVIRREGTR